MRATCFLSNQDIFDRAVEHLNTQRGAALLPRGGGAYQGPCGGCPVGHFIRALDYTTAMEGVPVRYLSNTTRNHPTYMDAGIKALQKALLRARIDVHDECTVALLSCLQNVHDAFGTWEWTERLVSIARDFNLSTNNNIRASADGSKGQFARAETGAGFFI
ncbi:hypothetical protein LJR034_008395 [Caballeronia sp. LjRoot34]|uniref:hypothetical protein n=1 Tax=Caballeronia sp. LjRoot34 TaxID=3342325 RepID=UPI003ECDBE25